MAKTEILNSSNAIALSGKGADELSDGTLILASGDNTSPYDLDFYYSTDDGATWALATGTITDINPGNPRQQGIYIDDEDTIWCAYLNDAAPDELFIKRGTFATDTITWDAGYAAAVGAIADVGIKRVKIGTSDYLGIMWAESPSYDPRFMVVKRTTGGTYSVHKAVTVLHTGLVFPTGIDFHHTGDGKTVAGGAPHFYLSAIDVTLDDILYWKVAHSATDTWTIGTKRTITSSKADGSHGTVNSSIFLFDGTRSVMLCSYSTSPYYAVFERDEADTATTERTGMTAITTPSSTNNMHLMVDANNQDIYVFAEDANGDPCYEKYDRAGNSWDGSLTVIDNTTVALVAAYSGSQFVSGKARFYWHDLNTNNYIYYNTPFDVTPSVTGTIATTNADDVSAASGTSTGLVGTIATTNADDVSAASGTHTPPAITGTIGTTNADDTSTASGTSTGLIGTIATTNADDVSAAAGVVTGLTGTIATTNADDTSAATGTLSYNFTTPTYLQTFPREREDYGLFRWGWGYPVGYTVLIESGVASPHPGITSPSHTQLEAADAYFRGGYIHSVTPAQKVILDAAGYTVP